MWELVSYSIYASILVSVLVATIGFFNVVNKNSAIFGGIAHASFGGIGIGLFLKINPLYSALIFSIAVAILLFIFKKKAIKRFDSLVNVIWAFGISIGLIFISLIPNYTQDVMSYLFGNIMLIETNDLIILGIVDILVLLFFAIFFNHLIALSYDKEFLYLRKVNIDFLEITTLILTALAVTMSVRVVGIILIIAVFSLPILIAEKLFDKISLIAFFSFIFSILFLVSGIFISLEYNISPIAATTIIATIMLLISLNIKKNKI